MSEYLFKSKHLGFRLIRKSDVHYLKELDADPEVKFYFPSGILDSKEIKHEIGECLTQFKEKGLPCFIFFDLLSGGFVGRADFGEVETGEIKVGYLLSKDYWNKGFATEMLTALLNWAKENIDADYIIAYADKDHIASFRVMEKCGMHYYKSDYYHKMECDFYRIKNR